MRRCALQQITTKRFYNKPAVVAVSFFLMLCIAIVGEGKGDIEKGPSKKEKDANKPPTDEIIPVYRRDCHEEVYCGSHVYPGRGVYLLKFDNSYSLWRSKTLYYRVYYTR